MHRLEDVEKLQYPEDLISIYQDLKSKYRNYDTRDALKRMQAFRKGLRKLGDQGFMVGLELLGSLNFGIVETNSDADLVVLHYCDLHKQQGECMPECANLIYARNTLAQILAQSLDMESFRIETLDCINLHYITNYMLLKNPELETDGTKDSIVLRFLFYCTIGRPVNLNLFSDLYKELRRKPALMESFTLWASDALECYLQTSGHRLSFHKYNERIKSRGLQLPKGLRKELKYYLNQRKALPPAPD